MSIIYLPNILLSISRNPVTALAFPLALGVLSGTPTAKVVRGPWYNVGVALIDSILMAGTTLYATVHAPPPLILIPSQTSQLAEAL
ncbi:hypothetical protein HHX47_DHR5000963 [Lentinula edodes]|nr:hypothetical protein HHX47_DHR5000963 [Lentinula edodes]